MYSLHCYPMWGSSKYPQAHEEEEQKNSEFRSFWQKLIEQWNPSDHKLAKCARSMVKYGPIPKSLRAEAWFVISGAAELLKNNGGLYAKLYSAHSDKEDLIEKDLPRTWGNHPSFHQIKRKGSQHCLRRLLVAYSNFDPSLGYCQGMNYIAGFLLHIFKGSNEEQAFWTFVVILRQIRSLFIDGLPGFHKIVHYFRRLCAYHMRSLHASWQSLGIDVYKLILTPWFHSLFSYPCLDCSHTARIWDLFLITDFSICVKIAFTIIKSNERKLSTMEFVDIIDFCKFLPCMKYGGKQLVQKSISIKLHEKYIENTRDLTRFDWQINKALNKEYLRHKKRRLAKEKEKQKIELRYKSLYEQKLKSEAKNNSHALSPPVRKPQLMDLSSNMSSTTMDDSESVLSVSVSISESSTTVLGGTSGINIGASISTSTLSTLR